MKHARHDYNRIQDPEFRIGADEPVLLFRAQDVCAPEALQAYADAVHRAGGSITISELVRSWAMEMRFWQAMHGAKMPDMPPHVAAKPTDPLQSMPPADLDKLREAVGGACCEGCGSLGTIEQVRARGAAVISCCPERKMLTASEWMARAVSAENELRKLKGKDHG